MGGGGGRKEGSSEFILATSPIFFTYVCIKLKWMSLFVTCMTALLKLIIFLKSKFSSYH